MIVDLNIKPMNAIQLARTIHEIRKSMDVTTFFEWEAKPEQLDFDHNSQKA